MVFERVILEQDNVQLIPLTKAHEAGLCIAINDGELWKLWVTLVPHPDDIGDFVTQAEQDYLAGKGLTFVIVDRASNQIVGSTRFMNAAIGHRRVEIGFTFLGKTWQRTGINRTAKYLLLQHAFETLSFNRVEFYTDYLNEVSRRAITALGAKEEGILRSHIVMRDGRIRDSVLYSIVLHEWPAIKQQLWHSITMRK